MDRDGLMIASDGDCSPEGGSDTERVISRCAHALGTYAQAGFLLCIAIREITISKSKSDVYFLFQKLSFDCFVVKNTT